MPLISDYLYRKASIHKIPLNGGFELSPVCNFSCKMCYVRKTPNQIEEEGKRLRTWQEWLALAEQCKQAGMLYLLLTGGEPFLYPHFRELYTQLHQMGLILSINTNGTMIDQETVVWLKKAAPSRVNITLYGSGPETYRRICGHSDGYQRVVNAIRMLKEAGIPVVINASMIPENADDMEAMIQFGREQGINTRVATYMFPPVRREREADDSRFSPEEAADMYLRKARCMMSREEYLGMLEKQMHGTVSVEGGEEDWGSDDEYMRCRAGRSSFWVSWDGTMTACGLMPFPVEVYPFERPFRDCWMELTNLVRSTPVLKGCAGCTKKEICQPCAAMLYSETGAISEKAPYLCRMADCVLEKMKTDLMEG